MQSIKTFLALTTIALVSVVSEGCKKQELTAFKADTGVNFSIKTVEYTFLGNPNNEHILEVPVKILGDTAGFDRSFKVEIVNDTSTTAQPNEYSIVEGIVPAGSFTGKLRVKLLNSAKLSTSQVGIKLRITDGADLRAGNIESGECIIKWSNKVVVPAWTYFRFFFTSVASTQAYRLIVQTTGLTTLTAAQYGQLGAAGAEALGTQFGNYVKQWNLDHPNDKLKHDDGTQAGQEIVPLYYTKTKYN